MDIPIAQELLNEQQVWNPSLVQAGVTERFPLKSPQFVDYAHAPHSLFECIEWRRLSAKFFGLLGRHDHADSLAPTFQSQPLTGMFSGQAV